MGLLNLLRKLRRRDGQARLLILGLDNAGKTTVLKLLAGASEDDVRNIQPTQGFNIKTTTHSHVSFTMWDIGGQKAIRPFWKDYFEQTDALVYVIDSADRARLGEAVSELHQLLSDDRMAGVPLLVFANKQDLTLAASPADISDALMLHTLRDRQWQIQPCSAKSGEGLSDGVDWLVHIVSP